MPAMNDLEHFLTKSEYAEHVTFWRETLGDLDGGFKLGVPGSAWSLPDGEPAHFSVDLPIEGLGNEGALRPFVVLFAAVSFLLGRYTDAPDVIIRTPPLRGGPHSSSSLPLRAPQPVGTVRDLLNATAERLRCGYELQDFPVDALIETMPSGIGSNVMLRADALHKEASEEIEGGLSLSVASAVPPRLHIRADPACFSRHFLSHFARHLLIVIAAFTDLDAPLSAIDPATEIEAGLGRGPERALLKDTVTQAFGAITIAHPDAVAIEDIEGVTTYAELDRQSNRLARFLVSEYGLERGASIGVMAERGHQWIVAIWGILKAGASYVPLDASHPPERLRHVIEDSEIKVLLVESEHLGAVGEFWSIPIFALDFQLATLEDTQTELPVLDARDRAYIIYTSGSTGRPKGVALGHGGLLAMASHHVAAFDFGPGDRLAQFYSPSFDGSIMEIFTTLLAGGCLILTPSEMIRDGAAFTRRLVQTRATVLNATPSYLEALDWTALGNIRCVITAGEAARVAQVRTLATGRRVHNSYGPTEATVCVTDFVVDPARRYGVRVPVGHVFPGMHVRLLDAHGRLALEGCAGEICIAGPQVAQGYINQPEMEALAFTPDEPPFGRMYRTGDLGVWLPDGTLDIIGRRDVQVKIRGFRIEPGEIEGVLRQHAQVRDAVVMCGPDDQLLAAVAGEATVVALDTHLRAHLPDYMVPVRIEISATLPLTASGKIDRQTVLAAFSKQDAREYVAPKAGFEEILAKIWAELLGCSCVSADENLFEIGGDSILVIQSVLRANRAGIHLTAQQVFEHPTIAALATVAQPVVEEDDAPRETTGMAGMTPVQAWFFSQDLSNRAHYNQSLRLRLPASVSPEQMRQAFGAVVARHDAFRLAFVEIDDVWQQYYAASRGEVFRVHDLSGLIDAEARGREIERVGNEMQHGFVLSEPPLLRACLFTGGEAEDAILLVVAHHLIIDGVSWRIVMEDLQDATEQLRRSEQPRLQGSGATVQEWSEALAILPEDVWGGPGFWLTRSRVADGEGVPDAGMITDAATFEILCDEAVTAKLLDRGARGGETRTETMILSSILAAYRDVHGVGSMTVELEGHGREAIPDGPDITRSVGWFTTHYPLTFALPERQAFAALADTVQSQIDAVPLRGLGYGIARYLHPDDTIRARLASAAAPTLRFNYLGQGDNLTRDETGWTPMMGRNGAEHDEGERRTCLFDVEALVLERKLHLIWTYNALVVSEDEITRLGQAARDHLSQVSETTA